VRIFQKTRGCDLGSFRALTRERQSKEEIMPNIHVDKVGEMAVVECEGRFVRSEEAYKLRDAVTSQSDANVIVLDLTETKAIGGGVVGVLVFLQRWCQDHDIRFKLFNPSRFVREKLDNTNAMSEFDIASLDEMMALLGQADSRYALAS
jgi:anti-anti-sigma regulatory factor